MDNAYERFIFRKFCKNQKGIEEMAESNDFDLIFPGKWEKSNLEETVRKN